MCENFVNSKAFYKYESCFLHPTSNFGSPEDDSFNYFLFQIMEDKVEIITFLVLGIFFSCVTTLSLIFSLFVHLYYHYPPPHSYTFHMAPYIYTHVCLCEIHSILLSYASF